MRQILMIAALASLVACAPTPKAIMTAPGLCESLRPALPLTYDGKADTPQTIKGIRQVNARYSAVCPP